MGASRGQLDQGPRRKSGTKTRKNRIKVASQDHRDSLVEENFGGGKESDQAEEHRSARNRRRTGRACNSGPKKHVVGGVGEE